MREFQAWCRQRTYEGKRWVPFAKGGEYSPYYADIHLVVNWEKDGAEMKAFSGSVIRNPDYYFRPGLTWPARPHKRGSFSTVQPGAIFSHTGTMLFLPTEQHWRYAGILNSDAYIFLLHLLMPRGGNNTGQTLKYEIGYVRAVPLPSHKRVWRHQTSTPISIAWVLKRSLDTGSATSHAFTLPALLAIKGETLAERAAASEKQAAETEAELRKTQSEIDEIAFDLYGFTQEERETVGSRQYPTGSENEVEDNDEETEALEHPDGFIVKESSATRLQHTADLLSWCVGVAFGRWDVRIAIDPSLAPKLPDPFDPLPVCPPGMLQGPDGLPAKPEHVPPDYPIRIDWGGILVDDPENRDDIVRRVRDVLEVIWKDRAEAIENEACEILGVRELRDYFRKPASGGFWMDHVKRYSKSRRKAPIYWYLRSAKGNYGIWLYYHRLDKDTLFKALLNYVEPKLSLVKSQLSEARNKVRQARDLGQMTKDIRKSDQEAERLESLLSELHDFAEKLRRAANLRLNFDLNDGVILNMAPLWELVPWNEPKKYWEELQEGKYDWSHIALQLWPDRVKELCKKDRSIAIAHGLEHLCEVSSIQKAANRKKKGSRRRGGALQ